MFDSLAVPTADPLVFEEDYPLDIVERITHSLKPCEPYLREISYRTR